MKTKIELQNETIKLIESWIESGKSLGVSNPQHILDLYEQKVKNLNISDVIKSLPTEQDCMLAGQERKSKLPIEYDKDSYELGFHQAYNWMLLQIYKDNDL